jgi:hypothetical protein
MITRYATQQTSYNIYVSLSLPDLFICFIQKPCCHETNNFSEFSTWGSVFRYECDKPYKDSKKLLISAVRSTNSTHFYICRSYEAFRRQKQFNCTKIRAFVVSAFKYVRRYSKPLMLIIGVNIDQRNKSDVSHVFQLTNLYYSHNFVFNATRI